MAGDANGVNSGYVWSPRRERRGACESTSVQCTYLFRVLSEGAVVIDCLLDGVLVGDLEKGEADDLGHVGGCVCDLAGRMQSASWDRV